MPSALSVDLRERVIAAIETGTSRRQAAKRFGVGAASAIRWHDHFRQEGRIAPKPSGGDHGSRAIKAHADRILALCEAHPQIFLRELRDALAEQGICTSTSGLSRFFARRGITRKKGPHMRLSRSGRT
jgi:transposase